MTIRIHEQLTKYHTSIGLTGEALLEAVGEDYNLFWVEFKKQHPEDKMFNYVMDSNSCLTRAFRWDNTRQGHEYWRVRDHGKHTA